jgi:hypothetical protein
MKVFDPYLKTALAVGVGMLATKLNAKYNVVVDQDIVNAFVLMLIAIFRVQNKPEPPKV